MADLFSIAKSGLKSAQIALNVSSHNISNVNTVGYSRQRVQFQASTPSQEGGFSFGTGSTVSEIERVFNQFIEEQLRTTVSRSNELDTVFNSAAQLDILLADPDTSISNTLNDFYTSLTSLSSDPASFAAREAVLTQGARVAQHFNNLYDTLAELASVNEKAIAATIQEITALSNGIAAVNRQVSGNPNPAADLLDQQNNLIQRLAAQVEVETFTQDDGSVNIFMRGGQALVVGGLSTELVTLTNLDEPNKIDISVNSNAGAQRLSAESIAGGTLGGLLSLRDGVLDTAAHMLGRMAAGVIHIFNEQHQQGLDLNGNLGDNFFQELNKEQFTLDRVLSNSANSGTARYSVTILDPGALSDSDYRLTFNGAGSYLLTELSTGEATSFGTLPQEIDGVRIELASGTPSGGDTFILAPTRYSARNIALNIASGAGVAAASPIRAEAGSNNLGTALITGGAVTDIDNDSFTTNGQLSPPLRVEFLTDTTYRLINSSTEAVVAAGPFTYNPATQNDLFPTDAMHVGSAAGPSTAGTLDTLDADELTINGTTITAASSDGLSTSDASASALAISTAINASTATHGVTAIAGETTINLGTYVPALLSSGQFQVNGQDIVTTELTQQSVANAIDLHSETTGVTASFNSSNELVLVARDGRNIQITTDGTSSTGTFGNFDLTDSADNDVARAAVTLIRDDGSIIVAGDDPADVGFTADTYTQYDPGYAFSISGNARAGDTFSILYNSDGVNDGTNAGLMLGLQSNTVLNNGTATINNVYEELIIRIGSDVSQVLVNQEATNNLLEQVQSRRDSLSGVNLDEEAVELVKAQQAYQASAEVLSVGKALFAILIEAV